MTRPLPASWNQSAHTLSYRLIKGLENACIVLTICTALFGGLALFLTTGDQSMSYLDLSRTSAHIPSEAINPANDGLTFSVDKSAGGFSAVLDIIIEVCFSIALFLTLKGLLSSLRHQPTAAHIAIGLRKIAVVTLVWPIAALLGQISGGVFSALDNDILIVNFSLNLPMLATGIAIWIGCMATQRLAEAEQELESVI